MFFKHIYEKGLAQASYLIGCQATKQAIVIDPKRDIDTYLEIAEQEKLNITHITETHIHADFLSGTRELAAATGARVYLSGEGGNDWKYQFDHIALKDNDKIKIGNLILEVMHTPGHTPEHISFLLTDTPTSKKPVMIFTGDFVFVGDIGRPDLLEKAAGITGTQEKGARDMFKSLIKFLKLDDYIQVWPGHGAGSACGKALGAVPSSTVGYEKLTNWGLNINDEEEFVKSLLDGQPEPPMYFAMMKKLNKIGPDLLGEIPQPKLLTQQQFEDNLKNGVTIIDTRDKISFAGGHLPKSINIQDNSSFSTWAGWLLDYQKPFMLIAREDRIEILTKALIRIGLDNIAGYINDIDKLSEFGYELLSFEQTTAIELNANLENYFILDVRGYSEFNSSHLPGAVNIHVGHLIQNLHKLPDDSKIVVHCTSGDRSAIAVSILLNEGFTNVSNLTCGINGWIKAKLPVEKSELVLT
ncbi:MAG: MBL fold metallo-hydrolase [Ignavibacteriaceae bacterium]